MPEGTATKDELQKNKGDLEKLSKGKPQRTIYSRESKSNVKSLSTGLGREAE